VGVVGDFMVRTLRFKVAPYTSGSAHRGALGLAALFSLLFFVAVSGCDLLTKELPGHRDTSWLGDLPPVAPDKPDNPIEYRYLYSIGLDGTVSLTSATGLYLHYPDSLTVCDGAARRVLHYSTDGTLSRVVQVAPELGQTSGRLSAIYYTGVDYRICDPDRHRVLWLVGSGALYKEFSQVPGTSRPIKTPTDITSSYSGWTLADRGTDTIEFFGNSLSGIDPWHIGAGGQEPRDLRDPMGVATWYLHDLLAIADLGNRRVVVCSIYRQAVTDYEVVSEYTTGESFAAPVDVAFGMDGTLFVSDRSLSRVVILDPDLSYRGTVGDEAGEGRIESPGQLEVAWNGNVFVCDEALNRVAVFAPPDSVSFGVDTSSGRNKPQS